MAVEEKELETSEAEGDTERNPEAAPEDEAGSEGVPQEQDAGKEEESEIPEPKEQGKKSYTNEELEELLTSDGEIDDTRLSPEGQLLKKSFQRGFNRKFEQLAEEKRNLKGETQPKDPKETYFQKYLDDTPGTVKEINAEILALKGSMKTLRANGEFEKADAEDEKATFLQNLREEFAVRKQATAEQVSVSAQFDDAVLKAIPDIDKQRDNLDRFAQEELGYTEAELYRLTNPESGIAVATAVRNMTTIVRLFKQANASKTVNKKVRKPTPPTLERGGAGGGGESKEKSPNDMSMEEFNAYMDRQEKQARR